MNADQNGYFDALPDPIAAASWATPFPDFEVKDGWRGQAVAHDLTIDYIRRIVEAEQ